MLRSPHVFWLLLALLVGPAACKPRDRGASRALEAAVPQEDAGTAGPEISVRRGDEIRLDVRMRLETFIPTPDGGFLVLDTDRKSAIVRRVGADRQTVWELPIDRVAPDPATGLLTVSLALADQSVWVAVLFDGTISYGGKRATAVRSKYDRSPDLVFARLAFESGKILAHRQVGQLAWVGTATFVTRGTATFAAVPYGDPDPGEPGWGPRRDPPRSGYRIIRLDDDAGVVWLVDSSARVSSATPVRLVASDCCLLVVSETPGDFDIGGTPVTADARLSGVPTWAALLAAEDGRVLRAEVLTQPNRYGDLREGDGGEAILDGETYDFALAGNATIGTIGILGIWQPGTSSHLRVPLRCGDVGCAVEAGTLLTRDAALLVVLQAANWKQGRRIVPHLFSREGEIVASTEVAVAPEFHIGPTERRDDGLTLYFFDSRRGMVLPFDLSVNQPDPSTHPHP